LTTFSDIAEQVVLGNSHEVARFVDEALHAGFAPQDIMNAGLIGGMQTVGDMFRDGTLFIPDMLASANALKTGISRIEPLLGNTGSRRVGKVVIGSVRGDIHDIGKNLVSIMLRASGFEVIDLGVNAALDTFLRAIDETNPDIVAMSALLTTTVKQMEVNISDFNARGISKHIRILVGGAAVTSNYARSIGANGYARDAMSASERALQLLHELKSDLP
jgi:5-methyltetrahydrofolate--homocysteine methyltransferase